MPWQRHSTVLPRLLGVLLSTVAPFSRAVAQTVGSVSAVNQTATGTPAGAAPRMLTLGADVLFNERIQTSAEGSTQLAFTDRSTLNVGRNSDMRIDEFVYSPAAGGGSMSLSLTKGVLRFVGGQVSHTSGATIKTPVAVVGVQGGVATIGFGGKGSSAPDCPTGGIFISHFGTMTLRNNVSEVTIRRPGYGVCITSPDEPIPPPTLIPDTVLKNFVTTSTSGPGQSGGAKDMPTDQMADRQDLEFPRLDPPPGSPPNNGFDVQTIIDQGNAAANQHGAYGWD